jgi:predicted RNA-binding protein
MCQAIIILKDDHGGEEFLRDVIYLKVEGDTIWLSQFFENPISVKGTIEEIDFLKHTVHIAPGAAPER